MKLHTSPVSFKLAAALERRSRELASASAAAEPAETARPDSPSQQTVAELLSTAQQRAALSGAFKPDDLFTREVDNASRKIVLSQLVENCMIERTSKGPRWTLLNQARASILKVLLEAKKLKTQLAAPLPTTDSFGVTLRELLRNGPKPSLPENMPALLDLSRAVDAVETLDVPKPDREVLRNSLAYSAFLTDFDTLLGSGMVGRNRQLTELKTWVAEPKENIWSVLLLTGLGGSGKSTLLVSLLRSLMDDKHTVVAVLDFDRPGVEPTNKPWLEFEISRQVGYQRFGLMRRLTRIRDNLREIGLGPRADTQSESERVSRHRSSRSLMYEMAALLRQNEVKCFVLALDTFETVVERSLQAQLFEWLDEVTHALSGLSFKVILSGRVFDLGRAGLARILSKTIEIGELDAPDAETLLIRHKVPEPIADRIANSTILPKRPLELQLLARLIERQPNIDLDELEEELRQGGPMAAELFSGLVYRRVLQRLPEGTTRQIAYPGLILRYLTVEILQEVLVPALELAPLSNTSAQLALDTLASHEWLVYRSDGAIWHRNDLRRSTLAPMLASDRECARRVRSCAIKYFQRSLSAKHRAEAIYHQLMMIDSPNVDVELDLRELRELASYFEANIVDFPASATALLKLARNHDLAADEVTLLPRYFRVEAANEVGRRLVSDGEYGRAGSLFDQMIHEGWPGASGDAVLLRDLSWRRDAAFATARWRKLRKIPPDLPNAPYGLAVLALLYPYEIAEPTRQTGESVCELLNGDLNAFRKQKSRPFPSFEEGLRRLAEVLALVNARSSFDARERRVLHAWVEAIVKERRLSLRPQGLPMIAALGRWCGRYTVSMHINEICLAKNWLSEFETQTATLKPSQSLQEQVQRVRAVSAGRGCDARQFLYDVDEIQLARLANDSSGRAFWITPDTDRDALWWALRGPCPDLRNPARFALLESFQHSWPTLALLLQRHIDTALTDLDPRRFSEEMSMNAEHTLATYIELVDRHWRLGRFLQDCALAMPSPKLDAVLTACGRREAASRLAYFGSRQRREQTED